MHAFLIAVHDHFIPHTRNHHHPHLLRHRHLFGLSAILITLKVAAITGSVAIPAERVHSSPITTTAIASLTNATREENGLTVLALDAQLTAAAQNKADDMVKRRYFDHVSPIGQTAMQLILASGYPVKKAAENLAVRFTEAEEVERNWLESRTHRENILNEEYRDLGVGIANGSHKGSPATFVVQLFGRSLETAAANVTTTATTTVGVTVTKPSGPNLTALLTGSLERTSQTADAVIAFLVATVLLLAFSIRLHERHLTTMVHAMSVIALALVLRLT